MQMWDNNRTELSELPVAHSSMDEETMLTVSVNHEVQAQAAELPTREKIKRLQEAMLPMQSKQPEPRHFFAPGMYLRELVVPAGMLMVGKIHKHEHFLLVLKGRAEVISEFGRVVVEAGHISISPAGVKRVVLALEDTQFVTVHVNKDDSQDLAVIEAAHIDPEVLGIGAPTQQEVLK
jgi:mannose-6-phosphate isomerase-like protein (cupin superfamily)